MDARGSAPAVDIAYLAQLLRRRAGLEMPAESRVFVESRLMDLMFKEKIGTLEELVRRLRGTPEGPLHRAVVESLAVPETSFYRDFHPFTFLETVVLPWLAERRRPDPKLWFWSAAASTGQEAYSMAMCAARFTAARPGWTAQVLGSDLSSENVRRARLGLYSQAEVNRGLPAPDLIRFFDKSPMGWQVKPALKALLNFREINLADPWTDVPAMDVVFLRNALMYFAPEARRAVLGRLRRSLRPEGFLLLGAGELSDAEGFEVCRWNAVTFFRPAGAGALPPGVERVERTRNKKEKHAR